MPKDPSFGGYADLSCGIILLTDIARKRDVPAREKGAQEMSEMAYGAPTATPAEVEVVGPRVLATLVDSVVLFLVALAVFVAQWIVGAAVVIMGAPTGVQMAAGILGMLVILAIPMLFVAYYVYFEGHKGQTIGKMMAGIKVVRQDTGGLPGTKAALVRTLLRVVDGFLGYLVGLLFALSSERRQRLGDMAAHTLVVRA
jgi:uncharacterized RDD family membrane protein YckC